MMRRHTRSSAKKATPNLPPEMLESICRRVNTPNDLLTLRRVSPLFKQEADYQLSKLTKKADLFWYPYLNYDYEESLQTGSIFKSYKDVQKFMTQMKNYDENPFPTHSVTISIPIPEEHEEDAGEIQRFTKRSVPKLLSSFGRHIVSLTVNGGSLEHLEQVLRPVFLYCHQLRCLKVVHLPVTDDFREDWNLKDWTDVIAPYQAGPLPHLTELLLEECQNPNLVEHLLGEYLNQMQVVTIDTSAWANSLSDVLGQLSQLEQVKNVKLVNCAFTEFDEETVANLEIVPDLPAMPDLQVESTLQRLSIGFDSETWFPFSTTAFLTFLNKLSSKVKDLRELCLSTSLEPDWDGEQIEIRPCFPKLSKLTISYEFVELQTEKFWQSLQLPVITQIEFLCYKETGLKGVKRMDEALAPLWNLFGTLQSIQVYKGQVPHYKELVSEYSRK